MSEKAFRPLLVVLSGPSGVGKGTIVRRVLERNPHAIRKSVTATTRPPRPGEFDGVHYHFLTREDFERRRERGDFLETADVYGNLYGTLREKVEETIESGVSCLLEIDVQGATRVRQSGLSLATVFLAPPSMEELERRLRHRGTEAEDVIRRRLDTARREMDERTKYDSVIVNDHIEPATERLEEFLRGRNALPPRSRGGGHGS